MGIFVLKSKIKMFWFVMSDRLVGSKQITIRQDRSIVSVWLRFACEK